MLDLHFAVPETLVYSDLNGDLVKQNWFARENLTLYICIHNSLVFEEAMRLLLFIGFDWLPLLSLF